MPTSLFEGSVRDFSNEPFDSAQMYIHPERPSSGSYAILSDRPIPVGVGSTGTFEVELIPGHLYWIEVLYLDGDRSRVGRSWWSDPFRMPTGGGNAGTIIRIPAKNGMVLVSGSDPDTDNFISQYVYNEETGDLFERTA